MKKYILIIGLLIPFMANAKISVRTDALSVTEGSVFQLEIQSDTAQKKAPNLKPLQKDFDIMGQSSAQSYQNVNGVAKQTESLILNLVAKKSGILTIPALTWGDEQSTPLQIQATPIDSTVAVQNETAVIIEATPLTESVYEGAALTYRVQVFERVGLMDGVFLPPVAENAEVIPLGEIQLSQTERDGNLYQVMTQEYLIFPKKVGSLIIEPASFQGYYLKKNDSRRDLLDSFGFPPQDFIYAPSATRGEILVRAKPTSITVLPRPSESVGQWWLPAQKVSLTQDWSDLETPSVGKAITRQVELQAVGAMGRMLPDIQMISSEDFKVYPEEPKKTDAFVRGVGLIGTQTRTFAIVPLKSGLLTLPPISVAWFNTDTQKMETATLSSEQINIAPNPQYQSTIQSVVPPTATIDAAPTKKEAVFPIKSNRFEREKNLLYFMAGLSLGLFIGVLGIIFTHRKRPRKKKLPELYPSQNQSRK